MKYSRYGISFNFLKEEDIELVRQWRNDPVVANNYEYREHITPEMQKEWFKSVNNIHNLYTVIEYQGEKIGVINIKNIDWEARVCEGGIFLPDPKYHQTFVPAIISYVTTEIIFCIFEWNIGYAHVLKENKSVQAFVKMLGYELMDGQEEVNNQQYQVTRESFEKRAPRIKKAISVLTGNEEQGVLCIERREFSDPLVLQWEDKVKTSRYISSVETREDGRFYCFS
ncbi:MAG: GNAT family N-acetyltransferase [Bacteroidetes bacterium]|nr:GNAT family N-acetyltransferase [Bacteroidota bacterium]